MKRKTNNLLTRIFIGLLLTLSIAGFSQKPNFNANTLVQPYEGDFAYGCNPGYYGGYNNKNTSDKLMGDLFKKAGFNTTRPALYDHFLEQYGLNIRIPEFEYYTKELKMKDLTLFVSGPSEEHRDTTTITCNGVKKRSKMFKNLYLPIWVTGSDGKAKINEKNYYAAYIYKVVTTYGKYVKFYEVWNEPDFTLSGGNAYKASGNPGNWYDNGPNPCDLDNMYANIESYVRTLRITYEVIKAFQPEAYVTTGGIGYESYLQVLLNRTDNPDNGKVTAEYPLKGGAYFDVLSYHYYPQYSLGKWDTKANGFAYKRHSDKAAQEVFDFKDKLHSVLVKNGYDDKMYPAKHYILTEVNIPRRQYPGKDWIGSEAAQRNFIIKTFIGSQKNDIYQMYTFCLGDRQLAENSKGSTDGMDLMGMYIDLDRATPATAKLTAGGIGAKSVSDFLYTYKYNAAKTAALALPANVDGGAFTKGSETRYVLWAKTMVDLSEVSAAVYTFPSSLGVSSMTVRPVDFGVNPKTVKVAGNLIALTGDPSFITVNDNGDAPLALSVSAGDDKAIIHPVSFTTLEAKVANGTAASYSWIKKSGPAAELQNEASSKLSVSKMVTGSYLFEVTVKDAKGTTVKDEVEVKVIGVGAQAPQTPLPTVEKGFKITYPQVKNMNNVKDAASNTFFKSTIRLNVETPVQDDIKSAEFTLEGNTITDTWADLNGVSRSFHSTYYALNPGTYTVNIVLTDKKGTQTATKATFTVSADDLVQERETSENNTVLSENGPYQIYTVQGVLLKQGTGQFDTYKANLAAGVYIIKTSEKSQRFVIEK